jgi:hypothetical protein
MIRVRLLMFLFIAVVAYRLLLCISYTPEISVGETNNVWNALNIAAGKALYTNPEEPPFEIYQYTPISQLVIVAAAKVFNNTSDNYSYYVMVIGRLFSLLCNLATFFIVYLILKNIFHVNKTLSFAAFVLGFSLLTHLAFAIRPDALAMFLTITSVYLFLIGSYQKRNTYYVLSAILFSVSFFVKQDSISILSVLGFFLLLSKRWKELFTLCISFVISFVVLLFLFHLIFGEYFLSSIVGGLAQGYSLDYAVMVFIRFIDIYLLWLLVGIVFTTIAFKSILTDVKSRLLLLLCIGSFAIAIVTSVKLGAWVNYYSFFIIYFIMLAFKAIDNFSNIHSKKNRMNNIVISTVVFCSVFFVFRQAYHYTAPLLKYTQGKRIYANFIHDFKSLKTDVEKNDYRIYTFDKHLKLMFYKYTYFPNTEYYHHTIFSFDNYNKLHIDKQLKYYIYDSSLNDEQLATLNYFNITTENFKQKQSIKNFTIFERVK